MKNSPKKPIKISFASKQSGLQKMTYEEALKKATRLEKQGLVLSPQTKKEIVKAISDNLSSN